MHARKFFRCIIISIVGLKFFLKIAKRSTIDESLIPKLSVEGKNFSMIRVHKCFVVQNFKISLNSGLIIITINSGLIIISLYIIMDVQ